MERFWNKELAGHPLNWLILVIVTILICFVIDAIHTSLGLPKPVTEARRRAIGAQFGGAANIAGAASINDASGTSDFSPQVSVT